MTLVLITVVVLAFGLGVIKGAPYVPILRRERTALFDLADLQPGQTILDLGSGDGRLLRAAAARGIRAIGYEINPLLVLISWIVCWRYRHLVQIKLANMWQAKLPPADAIYIFLLDRYMVRLDQKLTAEITRPTKVISHVFEIPGRTPVKQSAMTRIYLYGADPQKLSKPS
jgi:SAM-dependent methyltransferase